MSRQKVIDKAVGWLGCKESDGSHKQIIDFYNNTGSLPRGYKVQYMDAWCATYVSAVFLNFSKKWKYKECSCSAMITLLANEGKYTTDKSKAQKGDIIFYNWNGDYVSDHVGIITADNGDTWTVIEGNKNDAVAYRTIAKTSNLIMGYGLPAYTEGEEIKYYCTKYKRYCEG